jgi:hypothetical protein
MRPVPASSAAETTTTRTARRRRRVRDTPNAAPMNPRSTAAVVATASHVSDPSEVIPLDRPRGCAPEPREGRKPVCRVDGPRRQGDDDPERRCLCERSCPCGRRDRHRGHQQHAERLPGQRQTRLDRVQVASLDRACEEDDNGGKKDRQPREQRREELLRDDRRGGSFEDAQGAERAPFLLDRQDARRDERQKERDGQIDAAERRTHDSRERVHLLGLEEVRDRGARARREQIDREYEPVTDEQRRDRADEPSGA